MLIRELIEGVATIFGRKGTKNVRKYRCTSGPRKGRIVAKASTCSAPTNVKASVSMKRTRRSKGKTQSVRASRTKRTNPASVRLKSLNTGRRRIKPSKRKGSRRSRI
jgi:hypothetical protein